MARTDNQIVDWAAGGGGQGGAPNPAIGFAAAVSGLGLGRRLVKNSVWNIFSFVFSSLVTVAAAPLYIHYLGLTGYGLLVTLNTILTPLALLNFGFGQATIKYVAENYSAHRLHEAGRYLQSTLLFNVGVGLTGMLLIYFGAVPLADAFHIVEPELRGAAITGLRLVALGWFFNQIASTFMGVAAALQRFRLHSICSSLAASGSVVFGLVVLAFHGRFTGLMLFRAAWGAGLVILWGVIARRLLPGVSLWPAFDRHAFHNSFHFGLWQTVASVGGILAMQTDKILLTRYWGTEAVGIYSVPVAAFQQVSAVVGRLADVLFPAISNLQGRNREQELVDLMLRGSWLIAVIMVSAQATIFIYAGDILQLYMHGRLPAVATSILRLCAAGAIVTAASPGLVQFLLGTGRTGWMAVMSLSSGLITLVADIFLIPGLGVSGAAWGGTLAVILSRPVIYLCLWVRVFRNNIPFWKLFSFLLGPSCPGMILALGLQILHDHIHPNPGRIGLGFWSAVTFALIAFLIVVFDVLLPGHVQRRRDLYSLGRLFVRRPADPGKMPPPPDPSMSVPGVFIRRGQERL